MKLTKHFLDDVYTSIISLFTIVLTWFVGLGWTTDKIIPVHDGISMGYVLYKDFIARGGNVQNTLYTASWKGGSKLFEISSFPYDLQFFSWLNFSPQTMTNLHTFFIQFLCVTLSLIVARNIVQFLLEKDFLFSVPQKIFGTILAGFTPIIAWRLGMGHDIIVMGALAFLAGVAILTCNLTNSWSEVSAAVAIATFAFIFQSVGQQTLAYSIVFGLPFYILIISLDLRKTLSNKTSIILIALVLFSSLGISLTKFWPFFQNAIGTDSSRQLGEQVLTYSYITATLEDWFCSLFWSKSWIPLSRSEGFHHEVHYGLGPLLLLIFIFPFNKTKKLHLATGISLVMVLLFSMNITPFSDIFLNLFPFLKSFRVPERSIFSVGLILPILSLSSIAYWQQVENIFVKHLNWVIGSLVGIAILLFADDVREFFYWGLCVILLVSLYFQKNLFKKIIIYSLPVLALGSMSYFKEKIQPFQSESQFNDPVVQMGDFLKSQVPALKNPLNRVLLEGQSPLFMVNTSKVANLSSLDGYWFQPSRFTYTVAALQNRESNPTESFHVFDRRMPEFPILQQLYNIQTSIRFEQGNPKVEMLPPTLGAAWVSHNLKEVDSFVELNALLKQNSSVYQTLKETTFVVKTDPIFKFRHLPKIEGVCQDAIVKSTTPVNYDQNFILEVQSNGTCPVVVSANFISNFKAIVTEGIHKDSELSVFPANGSLIGIMVLSGVNKVLLKAELNIPIWVRITYWLSFVAISALFVFIRRQFLVSSFEKCSTSAQSTKRSKSV
jgi:hypothetical protein